jgi:CheY-like chemotaxis protein
MPRQVTCQQDDLSNLRLITRIFDRRRPALDAGALAYLTKPVQVRNLLKVVDQCTESQPESGPGGN